MIESRADKEAHVLKHPHRRRKRERFSRWAQRWFEGEIRCPSCASHELIKSEERQSVDASIIETWVCQCDQQWQIEWREAAAQISGEHMDGVWMERFDLMRRDRIVGEVAHLLEIAAKQDNDSHGEENVKMMLQCARRLRATLS